MTEDYEYRGLVAEAWDLLRGDTSAWADRAFYRAVIDQRGGPVLDVGCGAGRLLLDYLAAGFELRVGDSGGHDLLHPRHARLARALSGAGEPHHGARVAYAGSTGNVRAWASSSAAEACSTRSSR